MLLKVNLSSVITLHGRPSFCGFYVLEVIIQVVCVRNWFEDEETDLKTCNIYIHTCTYRACGTAIVPWHILAYMYFKT